MSSTSIPTHHAFRFDRERLARLAAANRDAYRDATPFPHVVLDDFLPPDLLDAVIAEFPSAEGEAWIKFDSDTERKLATRADSSIGEVTRHLLAEFNSAPFIEFLEELTGISGLVGDPYYEGGGLHQIERGGHLNIHVDFNRHPRLRLDRRLNAILYLNRDWQEEWGGALELWSPDMRRRERAVLPAFNRMVIFSTTERSFHGHPSPLACPDDRSRRSLALYYYSAGRPEEAGAVSGHGTVWAQPRASGPRARAKEIVKRVAPPILLDAARAARAHRRG